MHVNCGLWSAEVFEDDEGRLQNVQAALSRGKQMVRVLLTVFVYLETKLLWCRNLFWGYLHLYYLHGKSGNSGNSCRKSNGSRHSVIEAIQALHRVATLSQT